MKRLSFRLLSFMVFGGIFWLACETDSDTPDPGNNSNQTDVPTIFNKFSESVNIYVQNGQVVLESNGLPDHKSPYWGNGHELFEAYNGNNPNYNTNPNRIDEQSFIFRIPLEPSEASSKTNTSLGPIGISVNGVPLYNQYAGPNNQPLTNEINSFDQYNGHPQRTGQYHYHVEPLYITEQNGKGALIGFLLDGFPVYGPEENGLVIQESELDQYHGHFGKTPDYPEGIYHYHVTSQDPYINGGQFYGAPGTVSQ